MYIIKPEYGKLGAKLVRAVLFRKTFSKGQLVLRPDTAGWQV
jgi:hypothetical protein